MSQDGCYASSATAGGNQRKIDLGDPVRQTAALAQLVDGAGTCHIPSATGRGTRYRTAYARTAQTAAQDAFLRTQCNQTLEAAFGVPNRTRAGSASVETHYWLLIQLQQRWQLSIKFPATVGFPRKLNGTCGFTYV
jgi:hypothetical protein